MPDRIPAGVSVFCADSYCPLLSPFFGFGPVQERPMKLVLCAACMSKGFCPNKSVAVVGDDQLSDPDYLRDFKEFVRYLDVSDCRWHEHLSNLYRDFPGWIVGPDGKEAFLDMEEFERPNIREWFRDFLKPLRDGARPRVREEARERVRILATVLIPTA